MKKYNNSKKVLESIVINQVKKNYEIELNKLVKSSGSHRVISNANQIVINNDDDEDEDVYENDKDKVNNDETTNNGDTIGEEVNDQLNVKEFNDSSPSVLPPEVDDLDYDAVNKYFEDSDDEDKPSGSSSGSSSDNFQSSEPSSLETNQNSSESMPSSQNTNSDINQNSSNSQVSNDNSNKPSSGSISRVVKRSLRKYLPINKLQKNIDYQLSNFIYPVLEYGLLKIFTIYTNLDDQELMKNYVNGAIGPNSINRNGNTVLHVQMQSIPSFNCIVKAETFYNNNLIEMANVYNINKTNKQNETPIITLLKNGSNDHSIYLVLLKLASHYKLDLKVVDKSGKTAMHYAVEKFRSIKIIQTLLLLGSDFDEYKTIYESVFKGFTLNDDIDINKSSPEQEQTAIIDPYIGLPNLQSASNLHSSSNLQSVSNEKQPINQQHVDDASVEASSSSIKTVSVSKESIQNPITVPSNDPSNNQNTLSNTTTTSKINEFKNSNERKNDCFDSYKYLITRIEMIQTRLPLIYPKKLLSPNFNRNFSILLKTFIIFEIIQNGALYRYKEINSIINDFKLCDEHFISSKEEKFKEILGENHHSYKIDFRLYNSNLLSTRKQDLLNSINSISSNNCYDSERNICKGGNAYVYKGLYLGNMVAFKKIKLDSLNSLKELSSISALKDSEYCVKTYGVVTISKSENSKHHYIVMDLCEYTLESAMEKKVLPIKNYLDFFNICKRILLCIEHIHQKRFLHKDIKTANLLLTKNWKVIICDFGLTREDSNSNIKTNKKGLGTAIYMAPELYDDMASIQSDIYSIGIVFWEILHYLIFGRSVKFQKDNIVSHIILKNTVSGHRPPVPSCVDKSIYDLLSKMWATKPSDRPSIPEISLSLLSIENNYRTNQATWDKSIVGPTYSFNTNFIKSCAEYKLKNLSPSI